MAILVTGNAGYIGSHVVDLLVQNDIPCMGIDNLHRGLISNSQITTHIGDIRKINDLKPIFEENTIDCIFHLAALTSVPESAEKFDEYMQVNVLGTQALLRMAKEYNCNNIIFSSTASVYEQTSIPVKENGPIQPLNNYAKTKLLAEQDIRESGLNYVIFRYFNVVGYADWYDTSREYEKTNIVPKLLHCMRSGDTFKVYGNTYSTQRENPDDHTCVRDYIDVRDIARAHLLAYDWLKQDKDNQIFNLGTKHGTSVLELLDAFERANQVKIPYEIDNPRVGDPSSVIANSSKARELLNWQPQYTIEDSLRVL